MYLQFLHMRLHRQLEANWGKYIFLAADRSKGIVSQPNGANLTGGDEGSAFASSGGASSSPTFVPFNGATPNFSSGLPLSLLLGFVGVVVGTAGIMSRL